MEDKDLKRLLIDTIEAENTGDKDQLILLLKICTLTQKETWDWAYSGVQDQRKAYITLHIVPAKLAELESYQKYICQKCREVHPETDEYMLGDVYFKPGALPKDEDISQSIVFENIENRIISEIKSAKYVIWISMAWFNNDRIYKALMERKRAGITIEIALDDNDRNHDASFNLEDDFPVYWITVTARNPKIMHEKFCVIDLKTVIHGTFNWTYAANYNKEHIAVDENRVTAQ